MSSTESNLNLLLTASDLPLRLTTALAESAVGRRAQFQFSPQMSYGRHAGPAPSTARAAAVILLLFQRNSRWYLPLTKRSESLTRHGGQVSLPGGSVDQGETSCQAAVRELNEELGIDQPVSILGRLADCYVFASDFSVTPWVAALSSEPTWNPHDREVQSVVELPLNALFDDRIIGDVKIERGAFVFHAPCFTIHDFCIWGATSVILGEFREVLANLSQSQ